MCSTSFLRRERFEGRRAVLDGEHDRADGPGARRLEGRDEAVELRAVVPEQQEAVERRPARLVRDLARRVVAPQEAAHGLLEELDERALVVLAALRVAVAHGLGRDAAHDNYRITVEDAPLDGAGPRRGVELRVEECRARGSVERRRAIVRERLARREHAALHGAAQEVGQEHVARLVAHDALGVLAVRRGGDGLANGALESDLIREDQGGRAEEERLRRVHAELLREEDLGDGQHGAQDPPERPRALGRAEGREREVLRPRGDELGRHAAPRHGPGPRDADAVARREAAGAQRLVAAREPVLLRPERRGGAGAVGRGGDGARPVEARGREGSVDVC